MKFIRFLLTNRKEINKRSKKKLYKINSSHNIMSLLRGFFLLFFFSKYKCLMPCKTDIIHVVRSTYIKVLF